MAVDPFGENIRLPDLNHRTSVAYWLRVSMYSEMDFSIVGPTLRLGAARSDVGYAVWLN